MNHEEILGREPRLLNQEDRVCYFERGYLGVSSLVSHEWLAHLNAVTDEFVSTSMAGESIAPGRFRLRLESGKRVVVVSGSNNESARIELDIAEGRTVTRSVKFKRRLKTR